MYIFNYSCKYFCYPLSNHRVSEPKISSLGMFMQCNSSTGPLGSKQFSFDVILVNYVHVILIADILNQMIEEILNCYSYNLARLW